MARRAGIILLALFTALVLLPALSRAAGPAPAQVAEIIRSQLAQAQFDYSSDQAAAERSLGAAQAAYSGEFADKIASAAPGAASRIQSGFDGAWEALRTQDALALAAARAQIWTALLAGGSMVVETAITSGDGGTAQLWLPVREFRRATRFSRPGTSATVAVEGLVSGTVKPADVLAAVRAELLDTYQARLTESLHDLEAANQNGFAARRAETAALASGYFDILAPAYQEQRGEGVLANAREVFISLVSSARAGENISPALAQIKEALRGFRAAPLSPAEQSRRAGQLRRFLSLVPVEYGRGVAHGVVTKDFEIREAITFRDGAAAAFADLQTLLEDRDAGRTAQVAQMFAALESRLAEASAQTQVTSPDQIESSVREIEALLTQVMPIEWQQQSLSGDFDVISSLLDEMERAVGSGQYDMAESSRLEAYAVLESGPEARLIAFAPQFIPTLEDLFWYGEGEHTGFARLIKDRAPGATIKATRAALSAELVRAQEALSGSGSPLSIATNAAVIVFREGLEAVLILASLMAGLQQGASRRLRRPLWWGVGAAFGASIATWLLMRGILASLARYGERLEAIVSLVAIGVLLLITNWFFHKTYWTGWLAKFHTQKRRLITGSSGQWMGLATLGFTSIYREGFETVLFLQALVLEGGTAIVLGGAALGLTATLLIGFTLFTLQVKLAYKKMLVVTGVMIGAVLLVMVGHTVHVLQLVGWMPIHPIRQIQFPYWSGLWFGLFATWDGILLQLAAGLFVIGSYVLANRLQRGPLQSARPIPAEH
jgi:high-affinity iron transporter